MKSKHPLKLLPAFATLALIVSDVHSLDAATYAGNGRSGFGGVVGNGSLTITDNGTTLNFTFTRGSDNFNDFLVLYFDTTAGGAASLPTSGEIGSPFDGRRAVVNEFGSGLTFPTPFTSDYAFALKANGSVSNHLFSTPSGSNANTIGFVNTYTVGNFGTNNASSYTWSIPVSELGLTPNSGATFQFVTTYLNPNGGAGSDASFRSNEAFGHDPGATNTGFDDYSFPSTLSYTIIPEPSAALLGGLGVLALLRRRRF
jgi:hypothetical protein